MDLSELRRLVKQGEGTELEFKRKANHPDKIARELIAFANTRGGTLLVGVDDDGSIYGNKFSEEDAFAITQVLEQQTIPPLPFSMEHIQVNSRRNVLAIYVEKSNHRPHFLKPSPKARKTAYIRVEDMSMIASREMVQVLHHADRSTGVSIQFGENERTLLQYLDEHKRITLALTQEILNVGKRKASAKLVLLTRAGILQIHPSGKGDYFTLAASAFELP